MEPKIIIQEDISGRKHTLGKIFEMELVFVGVDVKINEAYTQTLSLLSNTITQTLISFLFCLVVKDCTAE